MWRYLRIMNVFCGNGSYRDEPMVERSNLDDTSLVKLNIVGFTFEFDRNSLQHVCTIHQREEGDLLRSSKAKEKIFKTTKEEDGVNPTAGGRYTLRSMVGQGLPSRIGLAKIFKKGKGGSYHIVVNLSSIAEIVSTLCTPAIFVFDRCPSQV
ncbi:hypothetical protein M9H77_06937 [Catharanthus roseus]|uniref:Uncharacterized protein n=1 Tax=Catharanthus roseus TaxID=4058 RepID=A0ACC0BTT0_CATRO|nr:hypothetical protein M9H77_06937 [Catharanthus roseus]